MKLLVSACLLGARCRYDGFCAAHPLAGKLAERHQLVPVCPEQLGGLPTPRPPAELRDGRIAARDGTDVTENFRHGAEEALALCRLLGCEAALLKERSPSCGRGMIYDGSFSGLQRRCWRKTASRYTGNPPWNRCWNDANLLNTSFLFVKICISCEACYNK